MTPRGVGPRARGLCPLLPAEYPLLYSPTCFPRFSHPRLPTFAIAITPRLLPAAVFTIASRSSSFSPCPTSLHRLLGSSWRRTILASSGTPVAAAHPSATWPHLQPSFLAHSILAVIAFSNSATRQFSVSGSFPNFHVIHPSNIPHPTAQPAFHDFLHLPLFPPYPFQVIRPIRGLHFNISIFSHSVFWYFSRSGASQPFRSFHLPISVLLFLVNFIDFSNLVHVPLFPYCGSYVSFFPVLWESRLLFPVLREFRLLLFRLFWEFRLLLFFRFLGVTSVVL